LCFQNRLGSASVVRRAGTARTLERRHTCHGDHWFLSVAEARERAEAWRNHYNAERPHSSLGDPKDHSLYGPLRRCPEPA